MSAAIRPLRDVKHDGAALGYGIVPQLIRFGWYLVSCLDVARQRRHLLSLDERTMNDIGIRPADISREVARSFWDIPDDQNPGR